MFEIFFKTFSEAAEYLDTYPLCQVCSDLFYTQDNHNPPKRVMSSPIGFHLYGDPAGYDHPSPTKRFNTKTVSQKDGNKYSAG